MERELHFEHGELTGEISVNLNRDLQLDDFFIKHLAGYNRDRFEAFTMRVFFGKETIVTLYAVDKLRQEDSTANPDKIPVRKFKLENVRIEDLLPYIESFNCTISTHNYPLEAMEVMNK